MAAYTNEEYADMHLIYGLEGGNGRLALRLYQEEEAMATPHHLRQDRSTAAGDGVLPWKTVLQDYKVTAYDAEFVIKGNVALLRCEVTGSGKEYAFVTSWIRDDDVGISLNDNIGKYAVFPTGELLVRHVDEADSKKKYRCQIYNKISRETRQSEQWARIIMTEPHGFVPPKIIHWRREAHAEEGDTVWLPCVAHGYPVPRVQWYRQEAGLMTSIGQGLRVTEMDGMLVIHRATMQDSGKYACIVNNTKGEEQVHSTLMIKGALRASVSPPEKIVTVGVPLLLRCDVSGSPIHYLKWKKNLRSLVPDSRVRQQSNNVLEITSVRLGDEGVYQCFVYNSEESAQGSSTVLIQADPPMIESHFKEETVPPGNPVSLRCVAKGHPLPKITWTADGEPIPASSRLRLGDFVTQDGSVVHSFLNISAVEVTDGREYACHADSDFGRVSHRARLNVPSPPIGRSPENKTALVGSAVELRCPVAGYPLTHFSWEKDGESLPNSHRHEIRPDGRMVIHYVEKMTDDGSYWCTASNSRRVSARGRVDVQVVAGPVVDPFAFPDNLREGRRTTVNCLVSAGDPPIAFRWLKDGETIPPMGLDITVDYLNQYTSSIFFERVGQKHNGNYTCIATNPYASANHTAEMLIQIPPRWIIEPKDAEVVQGSSIRVDCQADGFPKPIIRWKQLTSSNNSPETFQTIMSSARMQVLENGSLLVLEVGPSDEGSFLCQAFNGIGPGLSKMMTITVNVPAHFKTKFISQKVKKGDPVNLTCKAQGDTPLSVTWYKDGVIIGNSSVPRYTKRQHEHHDGLVSQLTAHSANRDDSAVFSCRASNLYGHDDSTIELIVQEPPDNPAQPEVVHISSRSIHARWTVPFNGNSPITRFLVITENEKNSEMHPVGTTISVTRNSVYHYEDPDGTMKTVEVSGTQTDATIRGLNPRTTYNIHILAENVIGRGPPSQYLTVTTDDEVPRAPPRQVKVVPSALNSLKVTWMPPDEVDQEGASITGYYVGYRAVTSGDKYLFKTLKVREGFKTESLLSNLQSSTQYSVVVQAFNDKGPGPQSDEVLATTFNFDPPKSPVVRISETTTNTAQIEWESSGSVDGYLVYIREEKGEWKEATLPRDIKTYTFESLKCGSVYQTYMIPFSNEGKGQTSDIIKFTTEGRAPIAPSKEQFLQVNSTSCTVYLSAWEDGGCPVSHYSLRYRAHHQQNWTEIKVPSRPKAYITGLNPGHWYKIVAGARNSAGLKEVEFDVQTRRIDLPDSRHPQTPVIAESSYMELQRRVAVITSAVCSAVVLVVILIAACTVLTRRRRHRPEPPDHADRRSTGEVQKSESVALSAWEKRPRGEGRASHCRGESLYLPCPYATARVSHFSVDGDTDSGVPHSLTIDSGNEHSYDVPIQVLSKLH